MLGVLAAPADLSPLGRVVEVGQAGVVELQVGAAQGAEPLHLVGVGGGQVGPKALDIGIDLGIEHRRSAAVVHHVRRRDGLLGYGRGDVILHEREVLAEDGVIQPDLAADVQRRGSPLDGAGRVGELHRDVAGRLRDPTEGVDEVHVPGGPPELAVGGRLQAHLLLHPYRPDDLVILDRAQVSGRDPARGEIIAGLMQPGRAEQAADVVGAERRARPAGRGLHYLTFLPGCRWSMAGGSRASVPAPSRARVSA